MIQELFSQIDLPVTNNTWIFFLVLCIILGAPLVFNRLKIPHIIGMILAGILIGPYGLNILLRDSSFELFGKVGIFYIMFLAGLEMDMEGFRKNKLDGIFFGVMTFLIPFIAGLLVGIYILDFSFPGSMLLACILASHTLVSYPIVSRYGVNRRSVVTISIAATMVALLSALIILAGFANVFRVNGGIGFWVWFLVKIILYCVVIFFLLPRLTRWFFQHCANQVTLFTYVLTMVFFCGGLAEFCGMEGILGAFLAGLVFNRFIPHVSPLMNRIEFVGNALFIPYFLIGVGMLINIRILFDNWNTLWIIAIMIISATFTKWLAAFLTCKILRRSNDEGWMMFGMTEAHAAGALAMVMVGTTLEVSPGVYLMNDVVMNGVVILILFSCIISSFATDYASRKMALAEEEKPTQGDDEKILIPMRYPDSVSPLLSIAMLMRNSKLNRGLIALSVTSDNQQGINDQAKAKKLLEQASQICHAADVPIQTQSRLATNIPNGILHALNEYEASEIILGMHRRRSMFDSFNGSLINNLLSGMFRQLIIVKCLVPVNTLRNIRVFVPAKAEFEAGFHRWIDRLSRMAKQLGCQIIYFGPKNTLKRIENYIQANHENVRADYQKMEDWNDIMLQTTNLQEDHLCAFILARKGSISYQAAFEDLPNQLKYFAESSVILIYPDQFGDPKETLTFIEPRAQSQTVTLYDSIMRFFSSKIHQ